METSRFLATDAGKQLQDFVAYVSDFAEQTLRALRQGLTYQDNINCLILNASLKHQVDQVINTDGKVPFMIHHRTVSSSTAISDLVWYQDQNNRTVVNASFRGAPTGNVSVVLVLVFQ